MRGDQPKIRVLIASDVLVIAKAIEVVMKTKGTRGSPLRHIHHCHLSVYMCFSKKAHRTSKENL